MEKNQKSTLSIQIEAISKYLEQAKKEDILDLSMRIYPVLSSQEPYISLYSAIKRNISLGRSKGASLRDIGREIISKACAVDE